MLISVGPTRKRILWFFRHIKRRVALALDEIGSGALPFVTILTLVTDIYQRIVASHNTSADGSTTANALNLTNVLAISMAVLILYLLVQYVGLIKTNRKLGILAFACVVIVIISDIFFRNLFDQIFISLVIIIFVSLVVLQTRREKMRNRTKSNKKYTLPLYKVLILLSIVFFIAGILSDLTGSTEMEKFLGLSILLLYSSSGLLLWSPTLKNHLPLAIKIRFMLLFLLGGALFIIITFFTLSQCAILGVSSAGIASYFLPELFVLLKSPNINLAKKKPETWQVIAGPSGKYNYKLVGTKISGVFNGHGLVAGTAYTLASYKSGNNVVVLGCGTANARGDLHITNDPVDVGAAQEWTGDYTGQPAGYKIWLVPVWNITAGILTWQPNSFLFETSLAR